MLRKVRNHACIPLLLKPLKQLRPIMNTLKRPNPTAGLAQGLERRKEGRPQHAGASERHGDAALTTPFEWLPAVIRLRATGAA